LDELKKGTKQINRGIVEQNLHVTRETVMPAILTENGFMDNAAEANLMLDKKFQSEVAVEHAKGICKYMGIPYVAAAVPTPKPLPKPVVTVISKPTVAVAMHRVIVGNMQIGAFKQLGSILDAVEKAVSEGAKSIQIERV
jgi:hypothetical protein